MEFFRNGDWLRDCYSICREYYYCEVPIPVPCPLIHIPNYSPAKRGIDRRFARDSAGRIFFGQD
jgi:hypothetical protein